MKYLNLAIGAVIFGISFFLIICVDVGTAAYTAIAGLAVCTLIAFFAWHGVRIFSAYYFLPLFLLTWWPAIEYMAGTRPSSTRLGFGWDGGSMGFGLETPWWATGYAQYGGFLFLLGLVYVIEKIVDFRGQQRY